MVIKLIGFILSRAIFMIVITQRGALSQVSNCTVHGGWTAWSSWSQCSASCGIAVKTRRRTCTNPEPRYGGRVCVGQERTEIYCHSLPNCPCMSNKF